ncbi:unnamed protein product [Effrenium voratum]|nr:unnamed protein product [Effrenium voratum]
MKLVCVRSRSHFWCPSQEKAVNRSFREDSTPDMLLEWLNKKVPKQDSPEAVLKAIDDFAWTEQWMMNVGDVKGKVLDVALREALRLHPTGVFTALELGTYLGYSAVRIARLLPSRGRLLSVDSAPQEVAEEALQGKRLRTTGVAVDASNISQVSELMKPPAPIFKKRDALPVPASPSPQPSPGISPPTPQPEQPQPSSKRGKGTKTPKEVLKKKSEALELGTQLGTIEFGQSLKNTVEQHAAKFEELYNGVRTLVAGQVDREEDYLPYVKQFLEVSRNYEAPKMAAQGMVKSLKVKNAPKKKAKAKPHTDCLHTLEDKSLWLQVPGYSRPRRLWDCMHLIHLGILRDVVASTLVSLLLTKELHSYVKLGNDATPDAVLHRFTILAKEWARGQKLDLSIPPLTESRLGFDGKSYPELDTRERPHLSDAEAAESSWLGCLHLVCYQALASRALERGDFLWRVRPKHHYIAHLLDETRRWKINPMAASTFLDEDHMKQLRGVSSACHPRTMLKVWARRYILKRTLLWQRM